MSQRIPPIILSQFLKQQSWRFYNETGSAWKLKMYLRGYRIKEILFLFFLEVLGLGVGCALLELLVVFSDLLDQLLGGFLFFKFLDVLSLEFLCILQRVHFLIVLLDLSIILLVILLDIRLIIWVCEINRLQGIVSHLQQLIKGLLFKLLEVDESLAPVEFSLSLEWYEYLWAHSLSSRCSFLLSTKMMYLSLGMRGFYSVSYIVAERIGGL